MGKSSSIERDSTRTLCTIIHVYIHVQTILKYTVHCSHLMVHTVRVHEPCSSLVESGHGVHGSCVGIFHWYMYTHQGGYGREGKQKEGWGRSVHVQYTMYMYMYVYVHVFK